MPPPEQSRPEEKQLLAVIDWMTRELERPTHIAERSSGSVLRRLNRTQYQNTIADLLGVDFTPGQRFPQDETAHGFDTVGSVLTVSPMLFERYLEAAETIAQKVVVEGPKPARKTRTFAAGSLEFEHAEREKDVILLKTSVDHRTRCWPKEFGVAQEGDYILKITASLSRHQGKAKRMGLKLGPPAKSLSATIRKFTVRSVPPGKPQTLTFRAHLLAGEVPHVYFPDGARLFNGRDLKTYKGPTLRIHRIAIDGPVIDQWPPPAHRRLFAPGGGKRNAEALRRILNNLARRAFRRPPSPAALRPILEVAKSQYKGGSLEQAVRTGLVAVLCSPHFLYLQEPTATLDDHALASRLSYFLWSTMPNDRLSKLAQQGRLSRPAVLTGEVERMLADPRSAAFVSNFVGQWLGTRRVGEMQPDGKLFPNYNRQLEDSMRAEPEEFFAHLLAKDLSALNLLESDFVVINGRLADHYQIPKVRGNHFRPVLLKPSDPRGGVLGQAAVLTVTSNGTNTSPVARGVWVLERLLGTPPSPPPPDVEPLEPDTRGATTIRQQLEKHRQMTTCNSCHRKIDPFGMALENFDPIGQWRTKYWIRRGNKRRPSREVDSQATLADGSTVEDVNDLKKYLLSKKRLFCDNLVQKLLIYATGRELTLSDQQASKRLAASLAQEDLGLGTLLTRIALSQPFRTK